MKNKWNTTKEERNIMIRLPHEKIELWAEKKEFWRIYRIVINATKKYYSLNKQSEKLIVDRSNI